MQLMHNCVSINVISGVVLNSFVVLLTSLPTSTEHPFHKNNFDNPLQRSLLAHLIHSANVDDDQA